MWLADRCPPLYPERFAREFDLVFRGESDLTFARFCRDYLVVGDPGLLNRLDLESYPGIYCRRGEVLIQRSPIHHPVSVIDRIPLPDRSGFNHRLYQSYWQETAGCKPTSIMITRGCPFSCDFCSKPVWGTVFRKPDLEKVFLEIEQIRELGYDQLWIADDSFTLDLSYLKSFCRRKIERGIEISWTCLSWVDQLDNETVALMKQAGCVKVYLGLETGCGGYPPSYEQEDYGPGRGSGRTAF